MTRNRVCLLSRFIICSVVVISIGSLFWEPSSLSERVLDVALRAYLMFVGAVMAHEASHGHLGATKAANYGWGRLALIPSLTPYVNFRKTHHLHHTHTNIPDKDPDHFVKPRSWVEIPIRALTMPHQWYFWLRKRGHIRNGDLAELVVNYFVIALLYGVLLTLVGPWRLLWGIVPALAAVSLLLWYPFALKTHEGFSVGPAESRSHDYYGRFWYWFSLGLSMHRVHHLQPGLTWLELKDYVERAPGTIWQRLLPRRDIRSASSAS